MFVQTSMSRALIVPGLTATLVLSGCTGVNHPIVQVDRTETQAKETLHKHPPSLSEAVAYAEITRQKYRQRIDDQMVIENATVLSLIPASALALFYGITGSSNDVILGLGIGGASAYAGSRYLTSKLQQHVYAAGAVALGCAVDGVAGLRAAHRHLPELQLLVEGASTLNGESEEAPTSLRQDVHSLEVAIASYRTRAGQTEPATDVSNTQELLTGLAALKTGAAALKQGQGGILILETAGSALWLKVSSIQSDVDREIINARPDLGAFVAGLSKGLFSTAGQLTAQPDLFAIPPVGDRQAFGDPQLGGLANEISTLAESVVRKSYRVVALTEKIAEKPAAEVLERCSVDVDSSGFSFAVVPSGEILVDASSAAVTTSFRASGGVPAYLVAPIGQAPLAGGIEVSVPDTHGRFAVTVRQGTTPGRYTMQVTDSAKGRESIQIVVGGGAGSSGNTAGSGMAGAGEDGGDDASHASTGKVVELQRSLASFYPDGVEVDGNMEPMVEDGKWGPVTAAASRKALIEQFGIQESEVPTDEAALRDKILVALGIR